MICQRWGSFPHFLSDMGERPHGHFIDRIDNDGPYTPENCQWATRKMQNNNTRRTRRIMLNGRLITMKEMAESFHLPYGAVRARIVDYGWSPEKAVTVQIGRWSDKIIHHNGQSHSATQWAKILNISVNTLYSRLGKLNWPIERALSPRLSYWSRSTVLPKL